MAPTTAELPLRGAVLAPGNDEYEEARRLWNGSIDRRPKLIARCADVADVRAAVGYAREHGLPVAVRGGGHSVAGYSVCDDGVVVDLSPMKGIQIDPDSGRVVAEPGLRLGELDRATQEHALAVPAGTVSETGLAGLTLGGGIGWLMRKYGLTVDNLLSVDVVTATGEVCRASADENADLFFGIRGAGANFGVTVRFEFQGRPVGPTLVGGPILHALEDAPSVMRQARELLPALPDEVTTLLVLLTVPPAEPFPVELYGRQVLVVMPVFAGHLDEADAALGPIRSLGRPLLDLAGPIPYVVLQSMLDGTAPAGLAHYNRAQTLPELTDGAIDALIEGFEQTTSPRSHVIVPPLDGAVARVPESETAFAQRSGGYFAWVITMWDPAEDGSAHVDWARSLTHALEPHSAAGVYVNALADEPSRVPATYGSNWQRLVELKRRYDPENVFRLNANIPPA